MIELNKKNFKVLLYSIENLFKEQTNLKLNLFFIIRNDSEHSESNESDVHHKHEQRQASEV